MTEPLQFDAAEPTGAAAALVCANCGTTIAAAYHMLNQTVLCERCRHALEAQLTAGSAAGQLGRAGLYGLVGAALGAAVYYAVLAITNLEIGLIAILVGWLVGRAVRRGSGGLGGRRYQLLAVGLTYLAIVSTYIPFIQRGAGQDVSIVVLLVAAVIAPFLAGFKNIIGLLIIGFALYQAWIMNREATLVFSGPFKVGEGGVAPA